MIYHYNEVATQTTFSKQHCYDKKIKYDLTQIQKSSALNPQKSAPLMMTLLHKQRLQTDCRAVALWNCVGVFPSLPFYSSLSAANASAIIADPISIMAIVSAFIWSHNSDRADLIERQGVGGRQVRSNCRQIISSHQPRALQSGFATYAKGATRADYTSHPSKSLSLHFRYTC